MAKPPKPPKMPPMPKQGKDKPARTGHKDEKMGKYC